MTVETLLVPTDGSDHAEEILAFADEHEVDLIERGTHGRGGFDRMLVGSVSEEVIRTATVPTLAVSSHRDGDDGPTADD